MADTQIQKVTVYDVPSDVELRPSGKYWFDRSSDTELENDRQSSRAVSKSQSDTGSDCK